MVLVIAAGFAALQSLGHSLLAKALEEAIGVPVRISRVHLGLFNSEIGVYGLKVLNPEGFHEKTLASIPEIYFQYDLASFFTSRARIKTVRLSVEEITVEKDRVGRVNLLELEAVKGAAKSLRRRPSPASREPVPGEVAPEPVKPGPAPQTPSVREKPAKPLELQIDQVILSLGRARYVDSGVEPPAVRELDLKVRGEVLRNVTDPQQVTKEVVIITLRKVGLAALTTDFDLLAKSLGTQFKSSLESLKEKFNL